MGFKDIQAGEKVAKAVAARFIKAPKTGTLGIEVAFEFKELVVGTTERLNWVGWLSEKAISYTMDTLVNTLGFNGNDECDNEGILKDTQALDYQREVKLTVELETYNGKTYPKIKYVNPIGGAKFGSCDRESIKGHLDKLGFKAAFLCAKQAKSEEGVPF